MEYMGLDLLVMGTLSVLMVSTFIVGIYVIRKTNPEPAQSSPDSEELEEKFMDDPP